MRSRSVAEEAAASSAAHRSATAAGLVRVGIGRRQVLEERSLHDTERMAQPKPPPAGDTSRGRLRTDWEQA